MNVVARTLALTLGTVLVLAVSGCAFSGPGTHAGGSGVAPETDKTSAKASKPTPPEPEVPDLPVLK